MVQGDPLHPGPLVTNQVDWEGTGEYGKARSREARISMKTLQTEVFHPGRTWIAFKGLMTAGQLHHQQLWEGPAFQWRGLDRVSIA